MKKRLLITLLIVCVLFAGLSLTAHAEARLDYVSDFAGILTADERDARNTRAAQVSEAYGFPVYIVTVYDHTEYVNGNIEYFSEEVFHSYGLGYGASENGVLLGLSMDDRDYDIYAHGDFGNAAFTDYGKRQVADSFRYSFQQNDWVSGLQAYLENCGNLMRSARNGEPVDIWIPDQTSGPRFDPMNILISFAVALLVAGSSVSGFKKQLKTAVAQTRASGYVPQGGVELRVKNDQFVNRTVTTRAIPRQTSPRSGGHYGGTTTSGSHGGSHSSGKF
jgi:uncharacterized membrane protein YgcG